MGFAYPIDSKVVTNPNGTIDYDRASSSAQLRGLIRSMITNGVNLTESTNLQVIADETMNVTVKAGYVIIEGAVKQFEDDVKLKIPNADSTHPRIDTVVARLNLNEDVRDIVIDVLQGTPSAEPTAPELTRTTSYYEVGLADILVEVGASQISQDVVTDTRLLNSRCGLATAIGEIDTETLFVQLTTDFNNWFESIKGQLSEDVAGSLQLQLDTHTTSTVTSEEGVHGFRYFENVFEIKDQEGNFQNVTPVNLKWAISDEIYSEETELDIPSSPLTGQASSMLYHNNKLYVIGFTSSSAVSLCIYENGEWKKINLQTNLSSSGYFYNSSIVEYNGNIYCIAGFYTYFNFYKLNDEETSVTCIKSVSARDSRTYVMLCKEEKNNRLYFGGVTNSNSTTGVTKTFYYDDTTGVSEITPIFDASQIYSACIENGKLHVSYISDGKTYYLIYDLSTNKGLYISSKLDYCRNFMSIRNKLYYENNTQIYRLKNLHEELQSFKNNIRSMCEYEDGILAYIYVSNSDKSFTKIRLYRTAKTYAPKGTKIYLQGETLPLSENLLTTDNGYVVTQDGEVKIAIYE